MSYFVYLSVSALDNESHEGKNYLTHLSNLQQLAQCLAHNRCSLKIYGIKLLLLQSSRVHRVRTLGSKDSSGPSQLYFLIKLNNCFNVKVAFRAEIEHVIPKTSGGKEQSKSNQFNKSLLYTSLRNLQINKT